MTASDRREIVTLIAEAVEFLYENGYIEQNALRGDTHGQVPGVQAAAAVMRYLEHGDRIQADILERTPLVRQA